MNKKGIFEVSIYAPFALILFALILIVAWFLFSAPARPTTDVIKSVESSRINLLLINYLRTPVDEEKNIADFIVESFKKSNYEKLGSETRNEFEKLTRQILDPLYPETMCYNWNLQIKLMPDDKELLFIFNKGRLFTPPTADTSIDVPLIEKPSKYLRVRLYEEC